MRAAIGAAIVALLVAAMAHAPASAVRRDRHEFRQVHMGVAVRLVVHAPDAGTAAEAARAAFARIGALDEVLSDYRPDSELNRLSASSGRWVPVSADLYAVLARAIDLARATDGAFDPTVGPLTALWREARRTGVVAGEAAVASARARVNWRWVAFDDRRRAVRLARGGMRLDLGGIAKGFALQEALAVLDARGLGAALLEAGGDLVVGDPPPGRRGWRVETPYITDQAFSARATALSRAALATSGPVFQFIESGLVRHSHVLDPRTGRSVTTGRVVGVIAGDGATADALATALGVLDPAGAARLLAAWPGVLVGRGSVDLAAGAAPRERTGHGRRRPSGGA